MLIDYGTTGNQLVDNTATDWGAGSDSEKAVQFWRDPLVFNTLPADGYSGAAPLSVVVEFGRDIQPLASPADYSTAIVVTLSGNPVAGTITPTGGVVTTLTWTPDSALTPGVYTVTVFNVRSNLGGDSVLMKAAYVFTFTVTP